MSEQRDRVRQLANKIIEELFTEHNPGLTTAYKQQVERIIREELREPLEALTMIANCRCEENHTCVRVARELAAAQLKDWRGK